MSTSTASARDFKVISELSYLNLNGDYFKRQNLADAFYNTDGTTIRQEILDRAKNDSALADFVE